MNWHRNVYLYVKKQVEIIDGNEYVHVYLCELCVCVWNIVFAWPVHVNYMTCFVVFIHVYMVNYSGAQTESIATLLLISQLLCWLAMRAESSWCEVATQQTKKQTNNDTNINDWERFRVSKIKRRTVSNGRSKKQTYVRLSHATGCMLNNKMPYLLVSQVASCQSSKTKGFLTAWTMI